MKGREAVRAAQRRTAEAARAADELRDELARVRADHRKTVCDLEAEVRRLRSEHLKEAGRLAEKEVGRRLAEAKEERRKRGMSDEMAFHFMDQKDKFVLNACRYVSMTKGIPPGSAFDIVMTWCLDDDFRGVNDPLSFCMQIGVPTYGWVARWLKSKKYFNRKEAASNRKTGALSAMSLDRAEREGHSEIHPDYNPRWYPTNVEYGELVIEDDKIEAEET